ncbi:MAG TPA: hypothetical protein VM529_14660 [Gemmata sp.]|nr:hypothetical protein [Gemmata sp.]
MTRFAALALALLPATALAQPVNLAEKVAAGDRAKYTLGLELKGELFFVQDGKKESLPLEAKARIVFAERVLAVADGLPYATARHYAEAGATAVVGADRGTRALPTDRRLVVARRGADGLLCFSPAGPLTRDELDLVAEHFNPQCLAGLLPGKVANVGDTWTVGPAAAEAACLFDALVKAQLTGKLTAVKDGVATFTIEGTAEGVENGARATATVTATGTFDVAAGRVTELKWTQKDEREQGPVSPASKIEATATLTRESLLELPKELADAALAKVPAGAVPAALTHLRHADPRGRYEIVHPRDWHATGETGEHLVLRLIDRGEFVAQATVTAWRKAEPGKHTPADEFKKAVAEAPGWKPEKVLAEGELPAGEGRWLYRVAAEGKMESQPAVQTFYLLAGPQGHQVAVTVTVPPDKQKAVGTRDADFVRGIEFGRK